MKYHLIRLCLIGILLILPEINLTNSFFSNQISNKNTFSTGCWVAPSNPVLINPNDNYISNSSKQTLAWNQSTNNCPITTISYYYELSSSSNFSVIIASGSTNNTFVEFLDLPNGQYYWRVKALDQFNNKSGFSQRNFIVDNTYPTSVITRPWNSNHDHEVDFPIVWFWDGKIEGTAFDNLSGIDHVDISIFRQIVEEYWDGHNWVSGTENSVRVRARGTTTWSYQVNPLYIPIGKFKIIAHAVDKAGNIENSATIEFENKNLPPCTPKLNLSRNNSRASFSLDCISQFNKLDYQIIYNSSGIEKGISGSSVLNNQDTFTQDNLVLGSCSSLGEVCNFDPDISQVKLDIVLTSSNGQIINLGQTIP